MNTDLKNKLKARAHHLKPVIIIGSQGVSDALIQETDHALEAHELIKVKVNGEDKADKMQMTMTLCEALHADFVQLIGHIAIIYRKKKKK